MNIPNIKRILLVDDSEVIRRGLGRILVIEGFSVDTAADGIEAQHLLNENDYDMVLTDIRMPVMTGIELYQQIEQICPKAANKVVFMSMDIPDPQTRRFFTKVNRPFLLKPFTMDDLMNAFRSCGC